MQGRHEVKHYINLTDFYVLRQRLQAVMHRDAHVGQNGSYHIRSLYFDTPEDDALYEKLNGVRDRDKFRLRYYDHDTGFIQLEKKSKRGDACIKTATRIDKAQVEALIKGDFGWMEESEDALIRELYDNICKRQLRPKTIVDYQREPFVYSAGNVRVTLDYDIRTGLRSTDFLNPACVTIPIPENSIILEVKWDAYLPDIVRDAVQLSSRRSTAFSKYAVCRMYD